MRKSSSLEPQKASTQMSSKSFKAAEKSIKHAIAIPIFSTICPMSIRTWNRHRLSRHRTSHLNHFTKYDYMQSLLEEAITLINTLILSINSKNQVATPKICQPIMYFRKGHLRCRYGKLPDGAHPIPIVNTTWTQTPKTVIARNRASLDNHHNYTPHPHPHPRHSTISLTQTVIATVILYPHPNI